MVQVYYPLVFIFYIFKGNLLYILFLVYFNDQETTCSNFELVYTYT